MTHITTCDDPLTPDEYGDITQALHGAIAADALEELCDLLALAPFDSPTYVTHLRALADAADPAEQTDPEQVRAELVKALQASAQPGHVISAELACTILDALQQWHRLTTETPEQRAIRQAFKQARRLLDTLGEDDPRTFDAIVKAIELQDPGCCDRMLKESGIHLPEPTHVNAEGQGLLTLEQVAQALDADPQDLMQHVERMEAVGMNVRQQPAGRLQ